MPADNYFISDQNATYFLTWTVIDWVDIFSRPDYRYVIIDSINYCIKYKGLSVFAWVIMSNHMHLICCAKEAYSLSPIIRDIKKFTSKKLSL